MKALIVRDITHPYFFPVKRVVVPEANNLLLAVDSSGNFSVSDGFEIEKESFRVEGEIDVLDELVREAIEFIRVREGFREKIESLFK